MKKHKKKNHYTCIRGWQLTCNIPGSKNKGQKKVIISDGVASSTEYYCSFRNSDSFPLLPDRQMASSMLFPNHAYRLFPCLDQLGMKATFDLFVAREKTMTAVSNTRLLATEPL